MTQFIASTHLEAVERGLGEVHREVPRAVTGVLVEVRSQALVRGVLLQELRRNAGGGGVVTGRP